MSENEFRDETEDLIDQISEEFARRCRAGEFPTIEEYVAKFPELKTRIENILPSVAMMEQLGRKERSDSRLAQHFAATKSLPIDKLGDFRLIREIGRGGMGLVYEAIQESLGRKVAVKILSKQAMLDEKHVARFVREARMASKLHHSNIVPVIGVSQASGYHYYIMQLIDGVGLDVLIRSMRRQLLKDNGNLEVPSSLFDWSRQLFRGDDDEAMVETPSEIHASQLTMKEVETGAKNFGDDEKNQLSAADQKKISTLLTNSHFVEVAKIGLQIAEALSYAHENEVLHRDIKPGNLILSKSGSVWVADFGLARAFDKGDVSRTGDVVGTVRYMSPEQLTGVVDQRSDIFSLGLTLFELLTLRPARVDPGLPMHESGVRKIRKLLGNCPKDLGTIVDKACAVAAEDRYQTARALADDLEAFIDNRPITARPWSFIESAWKWCVRNPNIATASAAAIFFLLLSAVIGLVGYWSTKNALNNVVVQKAKAETSLQISLEALDTIYSQLAPGDQIFPSDLVDQDHELYLSQTGSISNENAAVLEELLSVYDRFAVDYRQRKDFIKSALNAWIRTGDIRTQLGDFENAKQAYLEALELVEMYAFEDEIQKTIQVAVLNNKIGEVYRSLNQKENCLFFHENARRTLFGRLESLSAANSVARERIDFQLAKTFYFEGRANIPRSDKMKLHFNPIREGARAFVNKPARTRAFVTNPALDRAIEILHRLPKDKVAYQHLLALCYRDQPLEAKPGLEEAERVLLSLIGDHPEVAVYKFDLSNTYYRYSIRGNNDPRTNEEFLQQALNLSDEVVNEHPNIPRFIMQNTIIKFRYAASIFGRFPGQLERLFRPPKFDEPRFDRAFAVLKDAIENQKKLVEQFGQSEEYRSWLDELVKYEKTAEGFKRPPPRRRGPKKSRDR